MCNPFINKEITPNEKAMKQKIAMYKRKKLPYASNPHGGSRCYAPQNWLFDEAAIKFIHKQKLSGRTFGIPKYLQ
jgi:hypothetical protein